MKTKNIKIAYANRYSQGSYSLVPKLQMEGRWLEELGFSIGTPLMVEYRQGEIHIRLLNEAEMEAKNYLELQAALDRKSTELEELKRSMEFTTDRLSRVAEPEIQYVGSSYPHCAKSE